MRNPVQLDVAINISGRPGGPPKICPGSSFHDVGAVTVCSWCGYHGSSLHDVGAMACTIWEFASWCGCHVLHHMRVGFMIWVLWEIASWCGCPGSVLHDVGAIIVRFMMIVPWEFSSWCACHGLHHIGVFFMMQVPMFALYVNKFKAQNMYFSLSVKHARYK